MAEKLLIIFVAFAVPVLNALVLIWLCKVQTRREERYGIHGDVVELPAAARNAGGGAQGRSDRLAQEMSLTHLGDPL
jgi:hypothetical protein